MARRGGGPRALAPTVARLTKPLFKRRGFAVAAIVENWMDVVGPLLASRTMPERITFPTGKRDEGTLHLRVDSGALALEIQHQEHLLVERINGFFGYGAVSRLRMIQRPMPPQPSGAVALAAIKSDEVSQYDASQIQSDTMDPDLRAALERLGQAVYRRRGMGAGSDSKG
ncbi:MAG: DUF721 domain-containing protein [Rhodospirillales bacterium]|jgi:hypothetical protein